MQLTVRLPVDEYREVATRARARGWSMSDYAGWCIANELSGKRGRRDGDPLGFQGHGRSAAHRHETPVAVRDFDDSQGA